MKIGTNLYCSAFISQQKQEKYLKKIRNRKNMRNIHILIYRMNNVNLLELVSTRELYRLDSREDGIYVIGIVQNNEEAYEWIGTLVSNTLLHFNEINKQTLFRELECDV
ncbi:MAG: hypothetical protein CVU84_02375 [Firmicutes bacterium HGW-Firmicutes-1]|jgi:hypothetical protein|nr:MAG: hypothetical protein CVU84_02375 [Firmicutes bacterium HGW-Firmicutes-1]